MSLHSAHLQIPRQQGADPDNFWKVSSSPYNKAIKEDKEIDSGKQILKGTSVITASEIHTGHN